MANDLTSVTPIIIAQGLVALRQESLMALLVNRGYEEQAANEKGTSVNVPISSAITAHDVAPAHIPPSDTADIAPTSVAVTLDQWKEADFYMTDKDIAQAITGVTPMQVTEAVKALANAVDTHVMGQYKKVFGFVGTPASTPFATTTADATDVRKTLHKQLCPKDDRRFVIDPDAEANALNLRAFQDASWAGANAVIQDGNLNRKLGFNWFSTQNVLTHTAGTGSGFLVNNGAGYAIGIKTIAVDTGTGTIVAGDIITFAGHTQTYAVSSGTSGAGNITFYPGLVVAVADNVAITLKASHVVNLGIHRDCFALATRPLQTAAPGLGVITQSIVDPISRIVLRLEITHQHKRTRWAFDIHWGSQCVRPELGCRLAG